MRLLVTLLLLSALQPVNAQPAWKEFSVGPVKTADTPPNSIRIVRRGVFRAKSITAKSLIAMAGDVLPTRVLGPDWIDTERYSITAILSDDAGGRLRTRTPGSSTSDVEFQSLLRQEIISRFKLKTHMERKNRDAFLVRPSFRLKIRKSKSLEGREVTGKATPIINLNRTVDARGLTLLEFCAWLERRLSAPVIANSTLPSGTWDFHLHWRSGEETSLIAAVRNQTGLDLLETNAPVVYLVVDHIESPLGQP
jgi:uncharacterized protein (TIGR03435 family)